MVFGKGENGKYYVQRESKRKTKNKMFDGLNVCFYTLSIGLYCRCLLLCSAILFRFLLFDLCVNCVWVCVCISEFLLFSLQLCQREVKFGTGRREGGGNNGKVSVK